MHNTIKALVSHKKSGISQFHWKSGNLFLNSYNSLLEKIQNRKQLSSEISFYSPLLFSLVCKSMQISKWPVFISVQKQTGTISTSTWTKLLHSSPFFTQTSYLYLLHSRLLLSSICLGLAEKLMGSMQIALYFDPWFYSSSACFILL